MIREKHREFILQRIMGYSDFILLQYYYIVLFQCQQLGRADETLCNYINEMEYRGFRSRGLNYFLKQEDK